MVDPTTQTPEETNKALKGLHRDDCTLLLVLNKKDLIEQETLQDYMDELLTLNTDSLVFDSITISTKTGEGIDILTERFSSQMQWNTGNALVSNQRHWVALQAAFKSINEVTQGIVENRSSDLLAIDIRQSLHELGTITGEVTTDDILGNIFANFCIGK